MPQFHTLKSDNTRILAAHLAPGVFPAVLSSGGHVAPDMAAHPPERNTASCWCRGRGWPAPRWRRPPSTGSRWPPGWLAGGGRGRGDIQWHTDQTTQADSLDTCAHTYTRTRTHTHSTHDTCDTHRQNEWHFSIGVDLGDCSRAESV